ncbi:MAG: copper transporter [Firmicutes bacterium]|nr:copper transporter [Bacillota bacterium]
MIDWRTHALSLVAVFLALGLGIAIGGMMGSKAEAVVAQQENLIHELHLRLADDEAQLKKAQATIAAQRDAAQAEAATSARLTQELLRGTLAGRSVGIVNVGPPDLEGRALEAVRAAGGQWRFVLTMDPALVRGADALLAALAGREGRSQPLARYVAAWAEEAFSAPGPAIARAEAAGALTWVPSAPGPLDAVAILCPQPLTAAEWRDLVQPWLDAAARRHLTAVVATDGDAAASMARLFWTAAPATADALDRPEGQVALARLLAGAQGHYGAQPADRGWWPPSPAPAAQGTPGARAGTSGALTAAGLGAATAAAPGTGTGP